MEKYMGDLLNNVDAILLGRMAYQLLAEYWPSSTEKLVPRLYNLPKIVFQRLWKRLNGKTQCWLNYQLLFISKKESM
jgi:hypothetical protein